MSQSFQTNAVSLKNCRVAVEVLIEDIKESIARKCPNELSVNKAKRVSILGTNYTVGMLLLFGQTGGLPEFVIQIIIMHGAQFFLILRY